MKQILAQFRYNSKMMTLRLPSTFIKGGGGRGFLNSYHPHQSRRVREPWFCPEPPVFAPPSAASLMRRHCRPSQSRRHQPLQCASVIIGEPRFSRAVPCPSLTARARPCPGFLSHCRCLPVPRSDPVQQSSAPAVPVPLSTLVSRALPGVLIPLQYGSHQRWVPLEASGQIQHSLARGAGPSSASSTRASP